MLGELLAQGSGKRTGLRVLPSDGPSPKVEISIEGTSTVLGFKAQMMSTFWNTFKADGVLYGEGQGFLMTEQGDVVQFKGFGIARVNGPGAPIRYAVCDSFSTTSERLARLNSVAAVSEYEVDQEGNYSYKAFEWMP